MLAEAIFISSVPYRICNCERLRTTMQKMNVKTGGGGGGNNGGVASNLILNL